MQMNLTFNSPRTVTSNGVTQIIRDAIATPEFWAKWQHNKKAISDLGVCLIPERDSTGKTKRWIVRRVTQPTKNGEVPVKIEPVPLADKSGLLYYQVAPVSRLLGSMLSNKKALDASDTGTGKTYTSLKTVKVLGYQPAIVCTKAGIYTWKKVCAFFNIKPVFIYNWESCIGRIFKEHGRIKKITQPPCKWVGMGIDKWTGKPVYKWRVPLTSRVIFIFDEIHKASGNGSHNQRIVLAAKDYNVMGLSATLTDKIAKFRTIGALLGIFRHEDFEQWLRAQGCFINNFNEWESLCENQDMLKLSKIIFPNYGVRVRKSELPDFPDIQNIARLYSIKKADLQNRKYEKLLDQIQKLKVSGRTAQILTLQLRHRQLAEMYKVELLTDLVHEYIEGGMSVVVMVNFTDTVERLAKALKTDCIIQGGQDSDTRLKNNQDFQDDKQRVLIANIKAGGQSISLHDLNGRYPRICIICPTYDAKDLIQAIGRIHRAGAKSKAINLLVYAAGTIEEKVYEAVNNKIKNINTLNDGDLADLEIFKDEKTPH